MFQLAPFSERDSRAVISSLHPEFMDLGASLTLHQRSGGNALFLEELCRALRDDSLAEAGLRSASSVPSTVQGVIQVRVAALPPAQAELLRAASVIGIEFSHALLAEVAGEAQLDGALDFLCENDWIYATALPGSYRFKHGITRDVVYATVLVGERRRMHRVIASVLERCLVALDPAHAETLAYHHRGAGDYERAGHFAELAGDRALLASSLDRARFHYQAALSALDEQPQTPAIKRRWLAVNAKWSLPRPRLHGAALARRLGARRPHGRAKS